MSRLYQERGVSPATADEVARQLMAKDALGTHAREELGISHVTAARPVQAALTSAATFTAGASLPLLIAFLTPIGQTMIVAVTAASLLFLALLGAIGAKSGGAPVGKATFRVFFWRALAMAITAGIGKLVGTAV